MKMAVKRRDKKMKVVEEEDKESSIKLHKNNCDKLYRWSMWRMYLNEELSRVVSARRDQFDQSNSIYNVTSPYIRHPDGTKYGRQMKKLFRTNMRNSKSVDILPDNVYLVYGLPRVSLKKRVPEEVRQLHESVHELEMLHKQREKESDDSINTDEQISKLFDFVTSDVTKSDSQLSFRSLGKTDKHSNIVSQKANDSNIASHCSEESEKRPNGVLNGSVTLDAKSDIYQTKIEKDAPLASKSRLFWEKLANKKTEIIEIGKETKEHHEHAVISSEILQKQQKLLKKTIPKRTSKDLWRTLRERKTEILQLREMTSASGHNCAHEQESSHHAKKHESKTSQLWSFIFSKKKGLVQMKHEHKGTHESAKAHHEHGKKDEHSDVHKANSNISTRNFEDSFQKELEERLRKRRVHLQPVTSSSSSTE